MAAPAAALILIVGACFCVPFLVDLPPPTGGTPLEANQAWFSDGHLLGTDLNGNDVLSRLLHGGRVSLVIAIAVNFIGLVVGGAIGLVAGYFVGVADAVITRILDVLIAFPPVVLVSVVVQVDGAGMSNTISALSLLSIPAFARVARAAALRLRGRPFILVAQLSGTSATSIIFKHLLRNALPELAAFSMLGIGVAVMLEGALNYLGLGVPPPEASWGNMISHGQQALLTRPSLALLPSGCLCVTVLAFNLLADALSVRRGR